MHNQGYVHTVIAIGLEQGSSQERSQRVQFIPTYKKVHQNFYFHQAIHL